MTIISDEQQEEIQRFMDRRLEIRRDLRQVQHDLQRDIDSLGTRLKLINIGLVPALVLLVALAWGLRRRQQQAGKPGAGRPGQGQPGSGQPARPAREGGAP